MISALSILILGSFASARPLALTPTAAIEAKIDGQISQLSLEEKIGLLSGDGEFSTFANARLGIPALKMTDGPLGIRGGVGKQATAFPSGISLAATFNPELTQNVAAAISLEAKALGYNMLLAPAVNISRHPLGGRNFESFGEDPFLTSEMARGYLRGVHSENILSTTKHFLLNDQDHKRMVLNVVADERTLEEIYYPPFKAALEEGTWTIMAAYNKINSFWGSENAILINQVLKGKWGFQGLVVSDWWGTHSTVQAALAGLDIEMPDNRYFGKALRQAVQNGEVPQSVIDEKVRRILRTIAMTRLDEPHLTQASPSVVSQKKHLRLAKQAADESMVLLKNDNILPLNISKIRQVAVIGEGGRHLRWTGRGSAMVNPTWITTPFEALRARATSPKFVYATGVKMKNDLDAFFSQQWRISPGSKRVGLKAEYFNNTDLAGPPTVVRIDPTIDFDWGWNAPAAGIGKDNFSARWTGYLRSEKTGMAKLTIRSDDGARVWIDNKLILDAWSSHADRIDTVNFKMVEGRHYKVRFEYKQLGGDATVGFGELPNRADEIAFAEEQAKKADVAIVFAGLSRFYEGEEVDRATYDLPENQNELIERVARANPNTIVVIQGGNPVAMPWISQVKGVVYAWYSGQLGSATIADVLLGRVNPSGKLPVTIPKRWEDSPAFGRYPEDVGVADQLTYSEGIYVGYRHFDRNNIEPLFPFGYGLSYSSFEMKNLKVHVIDSDAANPKAEVSIDITNTSSIAGSEIAQLYIREKNPTVDRPVRELKGFAKVFLKPNETRTVRMPLNKLSFSFFHPDERRWVANAGEFSIEVGNSSRNLKHSQTIMLQ